MNLPRASFWRGKRIFVTGHSGFKGSWLTIWLRHLGAEVIGLSLPPNTSPNLFSLANVAELCESHFSNIRRREKLAVLVKGFKPDIVMHLAAQPLVRAGYRDPLVTYDTNVMGTAYLLDALRGVDTLKVAIMITTDKVYQHSGLFRAFVESDQLGGHDPYSASKAASEVVIGSYRDAYLAEQGVAVATARAGNVIGGGDWSEERLIPDAIRAWASGRELEVRRPSAIRPWQHVLDPLAGYLRLAECLWEAPDLAGAYNFGPYSKDAVSVKEVVELARANFESVHVSYAADDEGPHEAGTLVLDNAKAAKTLGVIPQWSLPIAVKKTVDWYRMKEKGFEARDLCLADIADFELAS